MTKVEFARVLDVDTRRYTMTLQTGELHGAHPIPGIAYATEFGKPPEDKPWAY